MGGALVQTRWHWDALWGNCRLPTRPRVTGTSVPARPYPRVTTGRLPPWSPLLLLLLVLCFAGCAGDSWFGRSATPSLWPFQTAQKEDEDDSAAVRKRRKIKSDIPPAKERGLEFKPKDD